ncbi:hypothetical protein KIPB_011716, partial [Kipferlia bialata]
LIALDVRNNSAWSYRRMLTKRTGRALSGEMAVCHAAVSKAPNNESSWNYAMALVDLWGQREREREAESKTGTAVSRLVSELPQVAVLVKEFTGVSLPVEGEAAAVDEDDDECMLVSFAVSLCIDVLEVCAGIEGADGVGMGALRTLAGGAVKACKGAAEVDSIRCRYWTYEADRLQQRFGLIE